MANPLLAHATAEQAALKQARDDARAAALDAERRYGDAREAVGQANADYAALEREVAEIRAELAEVETPADGEALLARLSEKIIALRAKNAEVIDAEREVALTRALSRQGAADLKRAEAMLAAADAALAAAKSESERRDALVAALADDPLAQVKQLATDALNDDPYQAAKARVEADVPQKLRERAAKRWQAEVNSLGLEGQVAAAAETHVGAELNTSGGLEGKIRKARAEYARALDALSVYVGKAKERLDHALALAARVADPAREPLTAAQSARINDAGLVQKGEDAAALEGARDDARALVDAMQAKVDKAILAARAADVDADPEANQDVIDARTDLAAADADYTQAKDDYLPAHKKDLDAWEAAVPDSTWRLFADFKESERLLNELKETTAQTLVDQLNLAENALAVALAAASRSARTLRALEAERQKRATRVAYASSAAPRLALSALRGDR